MLRATRVLAGVLGLAWGSFSWSGQGLTPDTDSVAWLPWQGRISVLSSLPTLRTSLVAPDANGLKVESVSVMGDYYFSRSFVNHGSPVGFRTTGGLLVGPRSQLVGIRPWFGGQRQSGINLERHLVGNSEQPSGENGHDTATLPYLGVGYSGLSLKRGWTFNADLGMLAIRPGNSIKLGRVVGGTQSLDDLLREMRIEPIFRLGVSYSF